MAWSVPRLDTAGLGAHLRSVVAIDRAAAFVILLRNLAYAAAFSAACSLLSPAHAQGYKCTDASGKTTYGDAPCDALAKPHKLPAEPTKGTATNPRVCDQLLDETRRLADEADVTAKRGGKESAE